MRLDEEIRIPIPIFIILLYSHLRREALDKKGIGNYQDTYHTHSFTSNIKIPLAVNKETRRETPIYRQLLVSDSVTRSQRRNSR